MLQVKIMKKIQMKHINKIKQQIQNNKICYESIFYISKFRG